MPRAGDSTTAYLTCDNIVCPTAVPFAQVVSDVDALYSEGRRSTELMH